MEKEFVPYELAVKLKVLEFDEPCFSYYMNGVLQPSLNPKDYSYFNEMSEINLNIKNFENVLAPTWQSAFRWFREKYNLYDTISKNGYMIEGEVNGDFLRITKLSLKSHEEAELACLQKLIEILEKQK
jgi:hypothetical protein